MPVSDWGIDIGLGYAGIENPLNKRGSLESYVLPQWYYYGERFYVENLELGYSLYENDYLLVDAVSYLNDDGVLFNSDKKAVSFLDVSKFVPNIGMPIFGRPIELTDIERDFTYMAGIQVFWLNDYLEVKFVRAKDISIGHEGFESQLSVQKSYQWQDFKLFWELGGIRKSANINNYYYGVRAEESGLRRDALVAAESLNNYFVKIATTYRLSESTSAVVSLHHTWIDDELLISPLLLKDKYLSGFVGINVHF
ncbi:MipA/OmpV family protein [Alteromonas facilis]|uniref:MipA/OmpV family protein n=1 Tax=Alteromonas facilis TaxID=2048004 RepID=UPI0013D90677|nr:MipA/OmpV family protein [Alteromonas facilis]